MREDAYIFRIGYKDTIRMMDLENTLNSTRRLYQYYLAEQTGKKSIAAFANTVHIKSVRQGSILAEVLTYLPDYPMLSSLFTEVLCYLLREVARKTCMKELHGDKKKGRNKTTSFFTASIQKCGGTISTDVRIVTIYEYYLVLRKKEKDSGLPHMKYEMIKKLFSALKNDVTLEIADQQGQILRVEHDHGDCFKMTCNFRPVK